MSTEEAITRIVAERRNEQKRLIEVARGYAVGLRKQLPVIAASMIGSVARGDFNLWSDIDVVVIAEALPDRLPDRMELLSREAPAGIQAVGFTPDEFRAALVKNNPMAVEAVEQGIVLAGEGFFRSEGLRGP